MEDLYRVLQVDPAADPEVIEAAWRRLARIYHPDGTRPDLERMKAINAAHDVLADPARRAAYDRERGGTRGRGSSSDRRSGSDSGPVPCPVGNSGRTGGSGSVGVAYVACWRHPQPAVTLCAGCQAPICEWCVRHWDTPLCDLCVRREGLRRQWQLAWPITAAAAWVFLCLAGLALAYEAQLPGIAYVQVVLYAYFAGAGTVGAADLAWMLIRSQMRDTALRILAATSLVVALTCLCPLALLAGSVMAPVRAVLAIHAFPGGRRLQQQADCYLASQ